MKISNYLNYLLNAQTLEELWAAHTAEMAEYGFDRLVYGSTYYWTDTSLGDPEDFVILTNQPEKYVEGFVHTGLYFHSPMLKWALENEGYCCWSRIPELFPDGTMTSEERKVHEFNKRMGVSAGCTVSFRSVSPRSKGVMSLCANKDLTQDDVDEIWERQGEDLLLMNNTAHLKILALPYRPPNRGLTKRQREALHWVGDGKTTQDIALLMGLTPATVEKHLRLARETLSVETTAQAVLKASLHNQMFLLEA